MVLKYHPDRGGDPYKFNIIQKCYTKLKNDFEMKQNNRTAYEMKNSHTDYTEQQRGVMNKELCRNKFNVNRDGRQVLMSDIPNDKNTKQINKWGMDVTFPR